MKLKFYLRGLGIGMLIATLILTISTSVQGGKSDKNEESTTSASVINYTKADTSQSQTNGVTEVATNAATDVTQLGVQETTQSGQTAAQDTTAGQTTTSAQTTTQAQSTSKAATQSAGQSIKVALNNINYSSKAAQLIADAGVVDDADALNKYLVDNGYSTKIVDGTYTFTKGQDYESIAKTITKK